MKKFKILKNPFVVMGSIVLGAVIGIESKELTLFFSPFGKAYLYLLQMCVIPILFTSIIASVGQLMKQSSSKLVKKIVIYFFISVLFTSAFGVAIGLIGQPGKNLNQDSKDALGQHVQISSFSKESQILEVEIFSEIKKEEFKSNPLIEFITGIIPENIFKSLSGGRAMEVVFFTIILGISIGLLKTRESMDIISISNSLSISFQKIMNTAIYFLPFGLMFLVANQVREVGVELIYPMLNLIIMFYLSGILCLILNTWIIKMKSNSSFKKTIIAITESMTIAFFTRNSLASIPAAILGLKQDLHFERTTCDLLVPLGITLARYGNILYFAISSIFVLQLYEIDYGFAELSIVLIGSILAGTATSGATGFSTLPLISIILTPLGIPSEVVLLLLFAIDAIVDPMRTLLIVHSNMLTVSLVANVEEGDKWEKGDVYKETAF